MVLPLSASEHVTEVAVRPSRAASVIVSAAAALVALLLAGAVGLWVHYGTTVFFEMIRAGIAACM